MAGKNMFQELKEALENFEAFLDAQKGPIKDAIQALAEFIPQITQLVDELIGLMTKLGQEIDGLDISDIPGLAEASTFTENVKTVLESAKKLLPDEADAIDDVLGMADIVSGLPSLEEIKQAIIDLIGDDDKGIIKLLKYLKAD